MKDKLKAAAVSVLGFGNFLRATHAFRSLQERIAPGEISALAPFMRGGVVLDVGANIGYTARSFAQVASRVVAIEPDADNIACLRYTVGQLSNVSIIACAVGACDGQTCLNVPVVSGVTARARADRCHGVRDSDA